MTTIDALVERYVAMWNEPDAVARRAAVEALWAPDGEHLTPTMQARGWDAIEARIAKAYEEWVRPGTFEFRLAGNVGAHSGTVKFNWDMAPPGGGAAVSVGFDFLVLDDTGRISTDYQSVESTVHTQERPGIVDRYVAVWNEPDAVARRAAVEALWAPDGEHLTPTMQARGWDAIEARIAKAYEEWVRPGTFEFRLAGNVGAHSGTVKFNWDMAPPGGGAAVSVGFDFLVLDDTGRISTDYQSVEQ